MAERTLPGLGLTGFWAQGNDSWKAGMDSNLRIVSALLSRRVLSRTTDLPASPASGAIYIVPATAPVHANKVAIWDGEVGSEDWVYLSAQDGWMLYVLDEAVNVQYASGGWAEFSSGGGGGGGGILFSDLAGPVAGDVIRQEDSSTYYPDGDWVERLSWLAPHDGSFRLFCELYGPSGSFDPEILWQVRKNGSTVYEASRGSRSWAAFQTDVAFSMGDVISIRTYCSGSDGRLRNQRLMTSADTFVYGERAFR